MTVLYSKGRKERGRGGERGDAGAYKCYKFLSLNKDILSFIDVWFILAVVIVTFFCNRDQSFDA